MEIFNKQTTIKNVLKLLITLMVGVQLEAVNQANKLTGNKRQREEASASSSSLNTPKRQHLILPSYMHNPANITQANNVVEPQEITEAFQNSQENLSCTRCDYIAHNSCDLLSHLIHHNTNSITNTGTSNAVNIQENVNYENKRTEKNALDLICEYSDESDDDELSSQQAHYIEVIDEDGLNNEQIQYMAIFNYLKTLKQTQTLQENNNTYVLNHNNQQSAARASTSTSNLPTILNIIKCSCNNFQGTIEEVKKHLKEKHERKCPTCQSARRDVTNLFSHMLTHTDQKPFKCNLCNFATVWPIDLKRHTENKVCTKP